MDNDLFEQVEALQKKLDISVSALRKTGQEMARTEMEYKMLVSTETLRLRDEGMPATLIDKVVQGLKHVAKAKFDWTVAETMYSANQDAINAYKLQLRLLDSQISREWSQAGRG